jgi:hypothetical protein
MSKDFTEYRSKNWYFQLAAFKVFSLIKQIKSNRDV